MFQQCNSDTPLAQTSWRAHNSERISVVRYVPFRNHCQTITGEYSEMVQETMHVSYRDPSLQSVPHIGALLRCLLLASIRNRQDLCASALGMRHHDSISPKPPLHPSTLDQVSGMKLRAKCICRTYSLSKIGVIDLQEVIHGVDMWRSPDHVDPDIRSGCQTWMSGFVPVSSEHYDERPITGSIPCKTSSAKAHLF